MSQMASIIAELFIVIGGIIGYLIFSGRYIPKYKTEKQREEHIKLIQKKGHIYKLMALLLTAFGVYRLFGHVLF